jgi:hypothetical protein
MRLLRVRENLLLSFDWLDNEQIVSVLPLENSGGSEKNAFTGPDIITESHFC